MAIVIVLVPCVALAETENNEEIHEVDSVPMNDKDIEAHSDHFMIKKTQDLSMLNDSITSLDISDKGEMLVCFTNKIMVFDECFDPIRAYEIEWKKGNFPFAIWNEASGNIVCIRSAGYEFNEDGLENVLYDATKWQKISQLISFFPIVFFIAVILIIITNQRKKAGLKRM